MSEVVSQCRLVYSEKVTAESHQIMDSTATMNNNTNQDSKNQTSRLFFTLQSVGIVVAIFTLMALFMDAKFDSVDAKFESQDKYLKSEFEGVYRHMDTRFDLESRFDHVNARIDDLKPGVPETRASAAYSPDGSTQ